jgi:ACS family pantothenate transporter-like MFS transporter
MALIWAWASDGLLRGTRWPFIYIGAVITVSSEILLVVTTSPRRLLTSTALL